MVKRRPKPKPRQKKKKRPEEDTEAVPPVVLRPHQQEALDAFNAGRRNQFHAWHRRAGKDWFDMYVTAQCMRTEIGSYWHMLPKHVQAKRAIWNGIDHQTGRRFLELMFPDAVSVNNTEMLIELESGSTWQLLGSDNYDRMVGANPRGVVFSEWALCNPLARDYLRPILLANGGWSLYSTTFRGRNHAYQMYQALKDNPDWFVSLKTVDDTGIVSPEDIEEERRTGMSERLIRQEYYCEPAPPTSLGPYARVLDALEHAGNVHELPDTARTAATHYVAVGVADDYTAVLEAFTRGGRSYITGGKIDRNVALHEVMPPATHSASVPDELVEDLLALKIPRRMMAPASRTETCAFLESAIVAPTSIVVAALTGALDTCLDEEPDIVAATAAVYSALERLASTTHAPSAAWGKPPDYSQHDRTVIGAAA